MYRFVTEAFGVCNVRRRKQRSTGAALLEIVEIETFHGSSSIVSSYRYERKGPPSGESAQQSEVGLCRYAIAQFLIRNREVHVACVEILDLTLPKFRGKLTSIPVDNIDSRNRFPQHGSRLDDASKI